MILFVTFMESNEYNQCSSMLYGGFIGNYEPSWVWHLVTEEATANWLTPIGLGRWICWLLKRKIRVAQTRAWSESTQWASVLFTSTRYDQSGPRLESERDDNIGDDYAKSWSGKKRIVVFSELKEVVTVIWPETDGLPLATQSYLLCVWTHGPRV